MIGGMAGHIHKGHEEEKAASGTGPGHADKAAGGMSKMIGKVTGNHEKVAEGQMRSGST